MLAGIDSVITNVSSRLPDDFPGEIVEPIINGINKIKKRLKACSLTLIL